MAQVTALKALSEFFNTGEGKVSLREFAAEIKALSDADKHELATLAAEELGHTLKS